MFFECMSRGHRSLSLPSILSLPHLNATCSPRCTASWRSGRRWPTRRRRAWRQPRRRRVALGFCLCTALLLPPHRCAAAKAALHAGMMSMPHATHSMYVSNSLAFNLPVLMCRCPSWRASCGWRPPSTRRLWRGCACSTSRWAEPSLLDFGSSSVEVCCNVLLTSACGLLDSCLLLKSVPFDGLLSFLTAALLLLLRTGEGGPAFPDRGQGKRSGGGPGGGRGSRPGSERPGAPAGGAGRRVSRQGGVPVCACCTGLPRCSCSGSCRPVSLGETAFYVQWVSYSCSA